MSRTRFHGNRAFHVDEPQGNHGGWYVEIRDGVPRGPFAMRELAERALAEYTAVRRDHTLRSAKPTKAHRQKLSEGGRHGVYRTDTGQFDGRQIWRTPRRLSRRTSWRFKTWRPRWLSRLSAGLWPGRVKSRQSLPQVRQRQCEGARFCQQCGVSLSSGKCSGCGAELPAGTKFCGQCGKPQQ